ncbi:MAG: DUF4055 domain-containing protein [Pseudomonadaceae bacterium]|nr:DUF4055 domain-containing protein [Pseudomonadaceae bacterium]
MKIEPNQQNKMFAPLWKMSDDLRGGTVAMRAAAEQYLPPNPHESAEGYSRRLRRATLTNFYSKAADRVVGKLLTRAPAPTDKVPARMIEFAGNVTGTGDDLAAFSRDLCTQGVDYGVAHILVDRERIEAETLADEQAAIPYWKLIHPSKLLDWDTQIVDGIEVYNFAVIQFDVTERDDFETKKKCQYWVYEPNRLRIYEEMEGSDEPELIEDVDTGFDYVPLVSAQFRGVGFAGGRPLLEDLAHLNVEHWVSNSEQQNITHAVRAPALTLTRTTESGESESEFKQIVTGPNQLTVLDAGDTLAFLEHSGKGVGAGRTELEALEQHIATSSLNLTMGRRPGNATATARALDDVESSLDLRPLSRELKQALEAALRIAGDMLGTALPQDDAQVDVFEDFASLALADSEMRDLLELNAIGALTRASLLREAKRRNLLPDDLDVIEELSLAEIENPVAGGQSVFDEENNP